MTDAEKCWSHDEETFWADFEDVCRMAFDNAGQDATVVTIYEADSHQPDASDFLLSTDEIIERAMENAGERHGEFSEYWLQDVTPEQEKSLEGAFKAAFSKWAAETGHTPRFFSVENVRELKVCLTGDDDFEIVKD